MSVAKGNAGEHLIMAELLSQGFDAYWADRGNPAFDVACFWGSRASRLRVKTTSNGEAVWSAKRDGAIFRELQEEGADFVTICDVRNGIRGAVIYVVPTHLVEKELVKNHNEYCAHRAGRNADVSVRVLRLFGEPRSDNPSYGYHEKFAAYREAWRLLR
jgi:hypothetical protein